MLPFNPAIPLPAVKFPEDTLFHRSLVCSRRHAGSPGVWYQQGAAEVLLIHRVEHGVATN